MPNKKKKYFGLFGLIGILIIGLLLFFLNSYFHDNSPSLEKQEEIVNFQEENNHQEEIIKENSNYLILFDNIISIIIFLLVFFLAFRFVYYSDYSPIVNNNKMETIKLNKKKDDFERSNLRRIGNFKGESYFEREDFFYFYDENKYNVDQNAEKNKDIVLKPLKLTKKTIAKKIVKGKNIYEMHKEVKYSFNNNEFLLDKYAGNIAIVKNEKEIQNLTIDQIIEIKNYSSSEKEKKKIIDEKIPSGRTYDIKLENNPEIKTFCSDEKNKPNYQEYREYFKGKPNFFNFLNIIAFLLSYGLFLLSFYVPFLFFYFLYSLIYTFLFLNEEDIEEENKFLLAFYRTLKAIIFFNFRYFLKIIPFLCLLGSFFFSGSFFFCNSEKFIPIIYDVRNKKVKKTMNFYKYIVNFKRLLEGKTISFLIDDRYDFNKYLLSSEEKNLSKPKIVKK